MNTIRHNIAILTVFDLNDRDRRRVNELSALSRHLDAIQTALDEHAPGPRAQAYDRTGSGGLVWCDTHERPVATCHRRDQLCEGVPLARHVDPTGDTATGPDTAHTQRTQLARVATNLTAAVRTHPDPISRLLEAAVRDLHGLDQWRRPMDPARAKRISDLELDENDDGCESCQRVGEWGAVLAFGTVKGNLSRPMRLCRWCYDFVGRWGQLPTTDQTRRHHRGERVYVNA